MSGKLTIVTAGAGTGKTYNLTQRLAELLGGSHSGVRPEAVLATTFTRRAAANLRERAEARLIAGGHVEQAMALGNATIGTVNAVCGALLSRYAYDIGLSPNLEVVSEIDAGTLFKRAVSAVLDEETVAAMNALATRLGYDKRDHEGKTRDWRKDVLAIVDRARSNAISAAALPRHGERAVEELVGFYDTPQYEATADGAGPHPLTEALVRALHEARQHAALFEGTGVGRGALAKIDEALRGYQNGTFREWDTWRALAILDGGKGARPIVTPIKEAASRFPEHPDLHGDLKTFTRELYRIASEAMEQYQQFKSERGLIDFADQESHVLAALDQPTVRARLQEDFDVALVDEFQDTSPIQLAIFLKLTELLPVSIWVGDPKQSIYGFRGADPALMQRALEVLSHGQRDEVLSTSYRSRPSLTEFTNGLFTAAFSGAHSEREVALAPHREEVPECGPPVALWHLEPVEGGPNNAESALSALADGVAALLQDGTTVVGQDDSPRSIRPGDIAVVCKKNDDVAHLAEELGRRGLQTALNRAGLLATPEGVLLRAVLRYLADPGDTLAQAEIIMLTRDDPDPAHTVQQRLVTLQQDTDWRADYPVFAELDDLATTIAGTSVPVLVDRACARLDLPRIVSRWDQAERRRGNIDALRALAGTYQDSASRLELSPTVAGFVLWLEDLARENEDAQAPGRGENAVNVLTYHKAKGLEWPVVVAADLGKPARPSVYGARVVDARESLDLNDPLSDRWIRFWVDPYDSRSRKGIPPRDRIQESETWRATANATIAESRRLLYVGFTRARDKLVLALRSQKGRPQTQWLTEVLGHEPDWVTESRQELDEGPTDDRPAEGSPAAHIEHATFFLSDGPAGSGVGEGAAPAAGAAGAAGRAAGAAGRAASTIRIFPPAPGRRGRDPYRVLPSELHAAGDDHPTGDDHAPPADEGVGKILECGSGMLVPETTDFRALGAAIHAVFAYRLQHGGGAGDAPPAPDDGLRDRRDRDDSNPEPPWVRPEADSHVDPVAMQKAAEALRRVIQETWTVRRMRTEVPVMQKAHGRLTSGVADLVVETGDGLVLIDHKVMQGSSDEAIRKAGEYAQQLRAYADILEAAERRPVQSMWIHLPVQGKLVEIRS